MHSLTVATCSHVSHLTFVPECIRYQFKLERWLSTGPSIAAAFAGVNENDVKSLFRLLQEMVQNSPQRIQDYESDASSFYDSDAGKKLQYMIEKHVNFDIRVDELTFSFCYKVDTSRMQVG